MSDIRYRDCSIHYWAKPIPTRAHDWEWSHDNYDGPGDGRRCGTAPSIEQCKADIDEAYEEGDLP